METQQTTTENGAAKAPPAAEPAEEKGGLQNLLDRIGELEPETAEDAEAEQEDTAAEEKPKRGKDGKFAKPQDEPEKDAKAKEDDEKKEEPAAEKPKDDPFSEEALATPEGVANARRLIEKRQRKVDGFEIKLKRQQREFEQSAAAREAEIQQGRALAGEVYRLVETVRTGTADQIVAALGELTGRDGLAVWQEITESVVNNGRRAAPSREVAALQMQVEQLRHQLAQGQQQDRDRAEQAEIEQKKATVAKIEAEIVELASDADEFPHLSTFEHDEVVDVVTDMKVRARAAGQKLSIKDACAKIESQLERRFGSTPSAGRKSAESGTGAAKARGEPRKATPTARGIPPSKARSMPSAREMTEEERLEDLRNDSAFLNGLFGPRL